MADLKSATTAAPIDVQDLIFSWPGLPQRWVLVIDETRKALNDGKHKEFVVFTAVCIPAAQLHALMVDMKALRDELPAEGLLEPLKGKNLQHLAKNAPEFDPLVSRLTRAARYPARAFIAATTIKNIKAEKAKVTITAVADDGRPRTISGPELKIVLPFLKQLGNELVDAENRLDAIVDRSAALGLAPEQRQLADSQGELLYGRLGEGLGPTFCIVSGSDDGFFADALLLPDFVGYLLVRADPEMLRKIRDNIMAPDGPLHYLKELLLPGNPSLPVT